MAENQKIRELKDAICFPGPEEIKKMSMEERALPISILDRRIEELDREIAEEEKHAE